MGQMASYTSLVGADMAMAFLWVLFNAYLRIAVDLWAPSVGVYGPPKQLLKRLLVIGLLFLFYWFSRLTKGATYNPITVIAYAAAQLTHYPVFVLAFRIPAQIVGAMGGAYAAVMCMPKIYRQMVSGPHLRASPHIGALVEGVLTFCIVCIVLIVNLRGPKSGVKRTWITSISRVSLSVLGAEYSGPAMNPANAFGWAYLKRQHTSWEHLYVYWITPLLATLAASWLVQVVLIPKKKEKTS